MFLKTSWNSLIWTPGYPFVSIHDQKNQQSHQSVCQLLQRQASVGIKGTNFINQLFFARSFINELITTISFWAKTRAIGFLVYCST